MKEIAEQQIQEFYRKAKRGIKLTNPIGKARTIGKRSDPFSKKAMERCMDKFWEDFENKNEYNSD